MRQIRKDKNLTHREERFIHEYLIDFNGARAAKAAGYTEKCPQRTACQLLANPRVVSELEAETAKHVRNSQIRRLRVLRELERIAFGDLTTAFDDAGFMKPISELPPELRSTIQGLDTSEIFAGSGDQRSVIGHAKKVKTYSKEKALELLLRHDGHLTDKVHHEGDIGIAALIAAANKPKDADEKS